MSREITCDEIVWMVSDTPLPYDIPLPAPAAGEFIMAHPRLPDFHIDDQYPVLTDDHEMRLLLHGRVSLCLHWSHDGCPHCNETDGFVMQGMQSYASWLPSGWEFALVPLGLTPEHIHRWLDLIIGTVEVSSAVNFPQHVAGDYPAAASPRDLVAHAYMLLRHSGLCPDLVEPRTAIDTAGCLAELRDIRHRLRSGTPIRPDARAPQPVAADGPCNGNAIRWRGKEYKLNITGKPYQLLVALWNKEVVSFTTLTSAGGPWADDGNVLPATISANITRIKNALPVDLPDELKKRLVWEVDSVTRFVRRKHA